LASKGKEIYERKENNYPGYFKKEDWTSKRKDLMSKVFCNFPLFEFSSVNIPDF